MLPFCVTFVHVDCRSIKKKLIGTFCHVLYTYEYHSKFVYSYTTVNIKPTVGKFAKPETLQIFVKCLNHENSQP